MNIQQWNEAVDSKRREREINRDPRPRWKIEPKPGSLRPFKHAAALYTAIIETRARLQDNLFELQQALAEFPPYVSRGHGWKGRIKNRTIEGRWNQDRSKYLPHTGKKELAKAAYRALPVHLRDEANRISKQVYDEVIKFDSAGETA